MCFVESITDKIEESVNKNSIEVTLSENDIFFAQPDNNNDALQHLLQSIAGRSSEEVDGVLVVHRQARTRITTIETIFKDKKSLMLYSTPYLLRL